MALPPNPETLHLKTPAMFSLKLHTPAHADPHGLVGKRVNIIQEDDSTVEGMVVDFNPGDQTHVVLVHIGTADETCEPLPLVAFSDAYQVCVCVLRVEMRWLVEWTHCTAGVLVWMLCMHCYTTDHHVWLPSECSGSYQPSTVTVTSPPRAAFSFCPSCALTHLKC